LNGVGESRLDLVIDRYRLAFIEPFYIEFVFTLNLCDVIRCVEARNYFVLCR